MNGKQDPIITRKELADVLRVSVRTIVRRHKEWGLDDCVANALRIPMLYFRKRVSEELMRRKVISSPL